MGTIRSDLRLDLVGFQVRTLGGAAVVGEVQGARAHGVRVHKIPGHPRHHGYLPAEAIAWVSPGTNTIFLAEGVTADTVLDAPPPPREDPEDWHVSADWWADLLGHYGLYDPEGRGNEPFLHPDQR